MSVYIGATVHTGVHLATNDFTFDNWNWGSFAGSVVAGGVGGGVSSALAKAGIGGFAGGAITGGASGFSQNLTSDLINGDLTGGGLAKSTLLGAGIAGTVSGIGAVLDGRNFGDGSKLLETKVLASDGSIVNVKQNAKYNCGPACAESIDASLGGNTNQDQFRAIFGTDPNSTGIGDINLWKAFQSKTGLSVSSHPTLGSPLDAASQINLGNKIAVTLKASGGDVAGHSVVLKSVTQKTFQKINGSIVQRFSFGAMNPAIGNVQTYTSGKILGAGRYFIIKP